MTSLSPRFKKAYDLLQDKLSDTGVLEGSSVEIAALLGLGSPRALRRALLAFEPLGVKRTNTYGQAVRIESGQSGHLRPARAATRAASPARAATGGLGGLPLQHQETTAVAKETTTTTDRPERPLESGQKAATSEVEALRSVVALLASVVRALLEGEPLVGADPVALARAVDLLQVGVSPTETEGGASCSRPQTVLSPTLGDAGRAQAVGPGPRAPLSRHTAAVTPPHPVVSPEDLDIAVEEQYRLALEAVKANKRDAIPNPLGWKRGAKAALCVKPFDVAELVASQRAFVARTLDAVPLRKALSDQEKAQQASERHLAYLRKNGVG